jgi:DNA-binding SARP family transcriptional activator
MSSTLVLELRLFGAGQARYADRPLAGFPNQQCYLLLCYLLMGRHRPHCREQLGAVFWGDYPTDVSRKHLSQALWRLRQALQSIGLSADEYLLISRDNISFVDSSPYWLDVEHFETAIARYQDHSGQDLTPDAAAQLGEAVDLYVGDLLEGVYEDWCLSERERLSLLRLKALRKLMLFHECNGTYERGLVCGERILAYDNTRERVHQQMMRLYWLLGDRIAALAQYKRCVQILREELGIPPMQETDLLYQQMVDNQFRPGNWPNPQNRALPGANRSDESAQFLAKHALQKLSDLHTVMEGTTIELHRLERLINKALLYSEQL